MSEKSDKQKHERAGEVFADVLDESGEHPAVVAPVASREHLAAVKKQLNRGD
jgi:hypothetical protein